jgi:hypothetical protein
MDNIEYKFFVDYESLKCSNQEFEILKNYLHQDGWNWFERKFGREDIKVSLLEKTPRNLALIGVKDINNKTLIPYYSDEIEYIEWDKEANDLIRDIRNTKLNQLGI